MRVTDKILHNNFIANLSFSTERLYTSENKVLTNKRLNKPSDSPVDAMNSLAIRSKLNDIEQYQRNIAKSKTTLQNTETVVSQVSELFQRVHTLIVQGASDSYGPNDKMSISYEVNQILEQVLNFANNRSESIYTFGGTNNDSPPYMALRDGTGEIESVKTTGSGGDIIGIIGENIPLKVNINGEELFEQGVNLFDTLIMVRDELRNNNTDVLRESLNTLQDASEKIINIQAIIGSRINRIEAADSRATNDTISFTEYLSNTEDVDASEAIMDYQMDLLTMQASLQAGARLIQTKLTDFLR